jgi:hypothetical protein
MFFNQLDERKQNGEVHSSIWITLQNRLSLFLLDNSSKVVLFSCGLQIRRLRYSFNHLVERNTVMESTLHFDKSVKIGLTGLENRPLEILNSASFDSFDYQHYCL